MKSDELGKRNEQQKSSFPEMIEFLRDQLTKLKPFMCFNIWHLNLIHELLKAGFVSEQDLAKAIQEFDSRCSRSFSMWMITSWFAPAMDHYCHDVFLVNDQKITDYFDSGESVHAPYKLCFEAMRENNWEMADQIISQCFLPGDIGIILRNDDIDKLQQFAAMPDFDYDFQICQTIFHQSAILFNQPKALQYAAFFGSFNCFKFLLENGSSIEETDEMNQTVLQFAIAGGDCDIIRMCLKVGCNTSGSAHTSILYFRNDLFFYLTHTFGISLVDEDPYLSTIFNCAAQSNNLRILIYCIENGVDVNQSDSKESTALHYAAQYGSLDAIDFLVHIDNILIDQPDINGNTPFMVASQSQYDIVEYFLNNLDRPFDKNHRNKEGLTALLLAVAGAESDIVELLLTFPDIDVNAFGPNQETSLHIATREVQIAVSKMLLSRQDCDTNITDKDGYTPLRYAILKEENEIICALIDHPNTNLNYKDFKGQTPLHLLCKTNNFMGLEHLLSRDDIDVNAFDNEGNTALHILSENGFVECARLFFSMKKNININVLNNNGMAPIHFVINSDEATMLNILLSFEGIDVNIQDNEGMTPMHYALIEESSECLKILESRQDINKDIRMNDGKTVYDVLSELDFASLNEECECPE